MVRDLEGVVQASVSSNLHFLSKLVVVETLALCRVLLLYEQMGLSQLYVEGDCSNVVHAAFGTSICSKEIEPIIFYIRYLLRLHLEWSLVHVLCEYDQVVHALAKLALSMFNDQAWVQTCPVQVAFLVSKDVLA